MSASASAGRRRHATDTEGFCLQGTQVNFIQRKQFKDKKNSHNSMMSLRPYSATTNPQTYKKEKCAGIVAKRPLSADTIFCNENQFKDSGFRTLDSDDFCENLPTKDCIGEVQELPSSQILKSLLSEPLDRNWSHRNGYEKTTSDFETDSLNSSEKSFGAKIQEFAQKTITDQGALIPGIKTKPPLPDKGKKKCDQYGSDTNSIYLNLFQQQESDDVFDFLSRDGKTFEGNYLTTESFQTEVVNRNDDHQINDNCFLEDLEEPEKFNNFRHQIDEKSSTSDIASEPNLSNTSFKNWLMHENNNLISETKKLEKQTDIQLQNLHKQQEELTDSIYNIEPLFECDDKQHVTNISTPGFDPNISSRTNSRHNSARDVPTKNKTMDLSDKQNKPTKNNKLYSVAKFDNHKNKQNNIKTTKDLNLVNKKQPKSILKPIQKTKRVSSAEIVNNKNDQITKKNIEKSSEKRDLNTIDDNVNSWMSSNNTTHESFLEFLTKLDDLDTVSENGGKDIVLQHSYRQDLPEQDLPNNNESSSCDDIASILEVLEKEDLKSQKNIESIKEILNNELADTATNLKNYDTRSNSTTSLASSSHYNEFLSYLEEVDQSCVKTLKTAKDRVRNVTKVTNAAINVENIPKLEDLLSYSTVELSHYVVDLSLRLKEKTSGVTVLQSELSKLRNLINTKSDEFDKSLKQKLKHQKDEFESVIKRHQKFIDQLIADKKSLNQQCEGLINEMKVLEDRYNTNMKSAEQRHKIELQKAKEMHMAAEKLRRDKWIEGKTQKIKEMTVKSLEPELQNMTTRHQQELSDLRSLHKRELEDLELRAARKTQQQCEALRQQLTVERETAIAHERDILRQRLEKLVESEEKGYQELRRRLSAEHSARLAECEERISSMANEKERAIEAIKIEFDDKLQTALRRHKTELKNMKESSDLEFDVWKNNYKKQQSIKLTEMEAQIRDLCKKERDREIELVIERLEQEACETKEQAEQAAENRLRRMKEKFEEEIKDLEKSVNEYKSKYSETKEKLLNHEDIVINLRTSMKQLQNQLQHAREVSDELTMDRNKMREQIKDEFITEMHSLQNEVKILKSNREDELQKIFAKVKLTVAHKDELLTELSQNNTNLQEKCSLLENLLEQQRKEYLIK